MKSGSVVVIGSLNIDLVAHAERIPAAGETVRGTGFATYAGGKGANQAVAAARLGVSVRMIGRLGEDDFGSRLYEQLGVDRIDTSGVLRVAGPTGTAVITVSAQGENTIVVIPGANGTLTPEALEAHRDVIAAAEVVLAQLEIPLETVACLAEMCAEMGVPLVLDPAPAQALPEALLRRVAWFTPNETEAAFYLSGSGAIAGGNSITDPAQAVRRLLALGPQGVVLKLGERGAWLARQGEEPREVEAFSVKAVDTTAAGDAFNGAFAAGLVQGMPPVEAARFAGAAAAISVTRVGAQPSLALRDEVERFLLKS
ncbi:ribokinase [Silvibacterium dinghuense]|uniref:Ribokinase n=1 Tax=Silvibacterium dinghuense TaxID=1560006 RepID=A0A4Q1S8P4_9BACT|nr:ribokinase [Silvibacterium dinghuense]RXS93354.1 ribokinase [Silvibacterium dinghuense]